MAITANTLPSIAAGFALPRDSAMELCSAQTLTSTGYLTNTLDLGNGCATGYGPGRIVGMWALDVTALVHSTTDETYALYLLGSNDSGWANGTVDVLNLYDFGLAAHRIINTILGTNTSVPPTNLTGTVLGLPYCNQKQGAIFRYVRGYAVIAGTNPSITLSSWLSPMEC